MEPLLGGQVNQAVGQMDEVTQQNAALVEEAAAAAQSLDEQAMKLNEMVSVFTVNGTAACLQTARSVPSVHMSRRAEPKRELTPRANRDSSLSPALASMPPAEPSASGDWETF
jgi:methyl-accepting chemotaxis protein